MDNFEYFRLFLAWLHAHLASRLSWLREQVDGYIHDLPLKLREFDSLHILLMKSLYCLFDDHRVAIYQVVALMALLYAILWYFRPKKLHFYALWTLGSCLVLYVVSSRMYHFNLVYEVLEKIKDFVVPRLAAYLYHLWDLISFHRGMIYKFVGTVAIIYAVRWYFSPKKISPHEYKMFMGRIRERLVRVMTEQKCYPILLRFAWSDAATYDHSVKKWPNCGGANGFIRHKKELFHPSNNGLSKAMTYVESIKKDFKHVSYADIIQMAGALAVELTGGPKICMVYGRIDAPLPVIFAVEEKGVEQKVEATTTDSSIRNRGRSISSTSGVSPRRNASLISEPIKTKDDAPKADIHSDFTNEHFDDSVYLAARLPYPMNPFPDGSPSADVHISNTFFRMGFSNRDIVALCGAHTIGRAFKDRSGVCPYMSGDQGATRYTNKTHLPDKLNFMPGGCSWTQNWLTFDNSYYKIGQSREINDMNTSNTYEELLWLPTDEALKESPEFKTYFRKYAQDQDAFFRDYALAHKKMSELGVKYGFDKPIKCD